MSADTAILLQPFQLESLHLRNRIVMAPMTRGFADGGLPGAAHVDFYRKRAQGEVGLILSEGTVIERPASRNKPSVPFFHGPALASTSYCTISACDVAFAVSPPFESRTRLALSQSLPDWSGPNRPGSR